jgi:hypothetical protein
MKKYYAQTSDQEDLISIGTIGLIKGITTFDPSKGARLATYAARCVENVMLSPTTLRILKRHPQGENGHFGAFWTGFRLICMYFPRRRILLLGMHPYTYIVLCCAPLGRFWRRPSSISGIADTKKSRAFLTDFAGADTAADLCRWRLQKRWE